MAYPANLGPYGFLPINLEGGRVFAGAIRKLPIASGYAYNIGYGDPVTLASDGTITRVDTSSGSKTAWAASPIGVFLGCSFTQTSGTKYPLWAQSWTASTTASDAYAIVSDDPLIVMKALLTNGGTAYTSGAATLADLGQNVGYYQPAGTSTALINTTTGDSLISLNWATKNTTATLPFRVVDFVRETALSDGTFVEALVEYTPPTISSTATVTQAGTSPFAVSAVSVTSTVTGGHFYRNPTGV